MKVFISIKSLKMRTAGSGSSKQQYLYLLGHYLIILIKIIANHMFSENGVQDV